MLLKRSGKAFCKFTVLSIFRRLLIITNACSHCFRACHTTPTSPRKLPQTLISVSTWSVWSFVSYARAVPTTIKVNTQKTGTLNAAKRQCPRCCIVYFLMPSYV